MITKNISLNRYDDCNECPFCEFPDKDGIIYCKGYKLRINKTIINKDGKEIPNPIVAKCGINGHTLTNLHGCSRWFNNLNVVNYND